MTDSVTITLPYPDRGLSPNSRDGWRKKAKLTAQYREDCGWAAKSSAYWDEDSREAFMCMKRPMTPPVVADVTFYVPDKRKRDLDNLCAMLKPAWDGMVDAGLLVGDDSAVFRVGSVSVEVGKPRVEVVLRS